MQPDNANRNNMYLQNTSNSTNSGNETIQNWEDKEIHYEGRYMPVRNEAYKQDEVTADKIVIDKMNTEVINKRTRRSNRLLVNDKKENLKTTICGKVLKQKRTTKKSNKTIQNTISNEMLTMLYKKLESEKYEKSMLPSFGSIRPNNPNNTLHISYGIGKQEESHYNYSTNNNRNMLQYLDYNNLRHENLKQPTLVNSNPWSIVSKNGQNFILNNIANTQNQVGQTGFINDKQYHNAYTADYNSKQNENPHYSSIKSTDSRQLFDIENKVFCCSSNVCTSNMSNNMHTGVEVFPKKENATVQQIANNNILSYIPPTVIANDTWNTAVGSFNYSPNYQSLQADYNFKRLFYSGFNTLNNVNNNGYNVMAKRNIMSPLNNWNPHINHLTIPYNSNTNVTLDASIPSEPLPSTSFYTGNNCTQFSNYYNKDLVKMDMSQYKERDNFNPSTMPSFENSLPTTNMHRLDSASTHTSSQNSTSTNESGIIYDITNFVSETNIPNGSQESPSYVYAKNMDKNWSNLSNI